MCCLPGISEHCYHSQKLYLTEINKGMLSQRSHSKSSTYTSNNTFNFQCQVQTRPQQRGDCFPHLSRNKNPNKLTRTWEKMGGFQVVDNTQMFRNYWPCESKIHKNTFSHASVLSSESFQECLPHFAPAALYWSRTPVSQTPWTRRWCWSQAAPQGSVSAWLSG